MLDIAIAYNRYKFLGNEFLTWLWFVMDTDPDLFRQIDEECASFEIGDKIVLEKRSKDAQEVVSIKGDNAGREEGKLSLKKGAVVTAMNLLYQSGSEKWRFSLKGESFGISGLKTPETGRVETRQDMEGAILEKIFLVEKAVSFLKGIFRRFLDIRLSDEWEGKWVPKMKKWTQA
ncbi:conserved hypothetical protein [Candidatus Desulfarcum epimagneticum]|uniref:Uncharacterized protein n=1 Tax=uncultured Desulfobacteraceae bacterium TaxID=218296 RepID=A0A484HL37_9BACT|nr:conserved hypothetical protein [uncultured Desulfobacteraceae bacterium]